MKNTTLVFFLIIACAAVSHAQLFVSPLGVDTNNGTQAYPFQTLSKALTLAGPDTIIYMRGGTYVCQAKINVMPNGTPGHYISIFAYPGETPLLDFTTQTNSDGLSVKGNYLHIRGLEIKGAYHNGINLSGNYDIIENCTVHDNRNSGIQMGSSSGTLHPHDNLLLNCDSYRNYDAPIGGNADGFAIKWNIGTGNVLKGCRSWNNSDDGYDFWMAESSLTVDSCFAFRNGVDSWFSGQFDGNGNGFKLGGNYIPTPHTVTRCVSFDNAGNGGRGFDENNNTAGQTLYNCTAYRNKGDNYHFTNTVVSGQHVIKNCVSFQGNVSISSGTQSNDSWPDFTVASTDFVSIDTALAVAPRNPDGSLPANDFFRLAQGSHLINAGVDVGLPYNGTAPDLGAFESSYPSDVASSGSPAFPSQFSLWQNYPNPFNPTTRIQYDLPSTEHVTLSLFNLLGQEVRRLVDEVQAPGHKALIFDAANLPSGLYLYRIHAGRFTESKKLILMK